MNWRIFFLAAVLVLLSVSLIDAADGDVADSQTIQKEVEKRSDVQSSYYNSGGSNSGWFSNIIKTVGSYTPQIAIGNWGTKIGDWARQTFGGGKDVSVSNVPTEKDAATIKSDIEWKLATRESELADARAALEKAQQNMDPAGEIRGLQEQYNLAEKSVKDMQAQIMRDLGMNPKGKYSPDKVDAAIKVGETKEAYNEAVKNAESPEVIAQKKDAADSAMLKYKDIVEGVNLYNNPPTSTAKSNDNYAGLKGDAGEVGQDSKGNVVEYFDDNQVKYTRDPETGTWFDKNGYQMNDYTQRRLNELAGIRSVSAESGNGGVKVAATGNAVYGYGR